MIWKNPKTSDTSSSQLLLWWQMPKTGVRNTGSSRASGPNRPLKSFPSHSIVMTATNSCGALLPAWIAGVEDRTPLLINGAD
ncbi:hypothetical protein [Paraburkholderia sp. RL17-347-BIC-D]|uniref:hypothetical protein n=1 Tax=Paraburkholderia sp. RL17-347-BIC-D TaxID=3031632 RepID=UPI0038BDBDB3